MQNTLKSYFEPASVAIVGATTDVAKAGYQITKNLVDRKFTGKVYPVNPKLDNLFGLACYPDLTAIPEPVELMVLCIPAPGAPEVFRQAARRGDVKAAVIVAAGFSETRIPERIALEEEVVSIAKEAGIRIFGPNCVGVMNSANNLDTSFAPPRRQVKGSMSIISQSGSLGASMLMFAADQPVPIGYAKWAHVGNMCDVDVLELLKYFRDDSETAAIAVYMEGIDNAREFMEVAREVTKTKPIIALKVGRSDLGSKAAASHTGSLAGSDQIYEGALKQSGVIRVNTIEELLDTAKAFSAQPLPRGNRVCILTEAGGPGIIAMDEIGLSNGAAELATLAEETKAKLREVLPPMAIICHPDGYIDMSAAANEEQHALALDVILADPGVDSVLFMSVPPSFLRPEDLAQVVVKATENNDKPVLTCFLAGDWVQGARLVMEKHKLPTFDMPERAARALINMNKRAAYLRGI
jgi:acetyl coenzyme A synthetase (ADP forming)-like protein